MSNIISGIIGNTIGMMILSELVDICPTILDIILTEEYYYLYGDSIQSFMEMNFNWDLQYLNLTKENLTAQRKHIIEN